METAVVSIVCIALIVFGGMTMSRGFISSVDTTAMALDNMGQRNEKILRTELSPTEAGTASQGTFVDIRLTNTGQTKLTDLSKWDIIIQYYAQGGTYYAKWLPYTSGALGNNQWTSQGIYWDGSAEVFEPGILNPGEEIRIEAKLNPAVGPNTNGLVIISTPNGVPASIAFSRPGGG